MFFNKNRKHKLTEEEKQKLLDEYGTTDSKIIKEMVKTIHDKYYLTRCNNLYLVLGDNLDGKQHFNYVKMICRRHYIIARERHALHIDHSPELQSYFENFLCTLDDKILEKQLKEKYSKEDTKAIIKTIRKYFSATTYDLLSVNINDYKIDEELNVKILPAKMRFANAIKMNFEETIQEKTM